VAVTELATLRIYRPSSPWTGAGTVVIEVDGKEVGRLRNGQDLVTHVESGRRNLRVRLRGSGQSPKAGQLLELTLAPGEYMRLETKISGWTGQPSLVRADGIVTVPPAPRGASAAAQVLGVTETHRSEEPIGTDTYRIDNTSASAKLTRTIRVTRRWSRMVSLDLNSGHSLTGGGQIGPPWLALRTGIEQSLSHTYSVATDHSEEFAEEFGIEVGPGDDTTVILAWKRLWQHGVVDVWSEGRQARLPFRLAVGITFDQSIR
jgi:hypothetical protein